MKDWIVVKTFDRIQQAQFRKALLEQNNIEAAVMVKQDSAFLLGEIQLWVKKQDHAEAIQILNEYIGWTLVSAFIRKKPLEILEEILQQSELETMLTHDLDPILNQEMYELYVRNEKSEIVQNWLKSPIDWNILVNCTQIKFAAYYLDILDKYDINALVIESKNSSTFLTEYALYVQTAKFDFAKNLLAELRGWTVIHAPKSKDDAEKWVDFLEENLIPAIFEQESENKNYYLYTLLEFENEATQLINENRNWKQIVSFTDFYQAMLAKNVLAQQNIEAIIMTKKDSAFLIGDIELYVDEDNLNESKRILLELDNLESAIYEE
jgi:hypothetical protein